MQKFKFKLDGLLKVREFKEKRIKIELAEILKEIADVEEAIEKINIAVGEAYDAQEKFLSDASAGRMIQFFPMFIQGKKEDLKNKESLLWALKKKYAAKVEELGKARGDVKVLENFKDKKKTEHHKIAEKKIQEEIEENFIMKINGANHI